MTPMIVDEINRWSQMILDLKLVDEWCEGAIFPREMAFFLARCSVAGVARIVESGRQDGYSTRVLGEFGRRTGVEVISIDYEEDKPRAERCRQRLSHLPVTMIAGNAFSEIGRVVQSSPKKTALLVDGPKNWGAVSILCAAAFYPQVAMLAMHNLDEGFKTRRFFAELSSQPVFYENFLGDAANGEAWEQLGEEERRLVEARAAARAGVSTIGVIELTESNRRRIAGATDPHFRTYSPSFIRWGWRTKNYGLVNFVFSATNKWLGPENYRE
jgi:hypothetical protein